ncbi:MAG TPA: hypothetical protein VGE86_07385 [Thermoanaerobaculia bacterium]
MARGWESKSVESQRDDAERARAGERRSPREREIDAKRKSLDLSRTRVIHDLQTARSDVHRAALENALKFLDGEIARLGS